MSDYIDLSNALLFADASRGIYIPQYFAQTIKRHTVQNVNTDEWEILSFGPEHEHYWDIWADVMDNARVTATDGHKYSLYQDGDLWLVPIE